jgi:hypothetical protein
VPTTETTEQRWVCCGKAPTCWGARVGMNRALGERLRRTCRRLLRVVVEAHAAGAAAACTKACLRVHVRERARVCRVCELEVALEPQVDCTRTDRAHTNH